jgi:transcriptional regulator with XRE-family HTH domain
MEDGFMEWWKRFIELREEKGVYQKDVAEYLGVAKNTYSQYEKGKREPSIEKIKLLALYYNCSIDYLIGSTDNKNSNSDSIIASLKKLKINDLKKFIDLAQQYQDEDQ